MAGRSLGWYDYGARFYEPELGRWTTVDPMTEEHFDYTPFAYVYNNPISFIAFFGLDTTLYVPELEAVTVTAKRNKHAETMNNPYVQAVHRAQSQFAENPFGNFVLWGWSYVVPIPFLEELLQPASKAAEEVLHVLATKGVGKNLIRIFKVEGKEVAINSGHGFMGVHETGSFSTTTLTMDKVEGAILKDLKSCINTVSKDGNNVTERVIEVDGVSVGYKALESSEGKVYVSNYYPNPTH